MAIGLSTRKNLSESNLNLKTALQKLYAPGIEDDLTLFSLSSSLESICFSGLVDDENVQITRVTKEKLLASSGQVLNRTKFNTKYFTFTDDNEVYFKEYTIPIGTSSDAEEPIFSNSGSIPNVKTLSGGEGFYFLDLNDVSSDLCKKIATWTASASNQITITLQNHGFVTGQSLELRFNNTGGGTIANYGTYVITSVPTANTFTVTHSTTITGSGNVLVKFLTFKIENVGLKGAKSGATNAKATVEFILKDPTNLKGTLATYTNTTTGTSLGNDLNDLDSELPFVTISYANHGFVTGESIYIQILEGSAKSAYVSVTRINNNSFKAKLICPSINTSLSCKFFKVQELTNWTPNTVERFSVSSVTITDGGTNYVIPESLTLIESNVILQSNFQTLKLKKQPGKFFSEKPEFIITDYYRYLVRGSSNTGFYLYDTIKAKYLFLDRDTASTGLTNEQKIELRRADNIYVENFLQFKYAQSTIYLNDYEPTLESMESLLGRLSDTSITASFIKQRSTEAIQNTRRPIDVTSSENIFGYNYNIFEGKDVVIKQRVVLRDQDYILNPTNPAITGDKLRDEVDRFVLASSEIRIPGLFIKVGNIYKRAFSTSDKPFYQPTNSGIANPQLIFGQPDYGALSAENTASANPTASDWYSYNVTISELAQRIHTNGKDGAFYYHRTTKPTVTSITTKKGTNPSGTIYSVPLFTLGS